MERGSNLDEKGRDSMGNTSQYPESGERYFSDWLQAYMEYTRASEAPDKLHLWTGISMIGGALRRCIWYDMGHFRWYPNFYIIFVAPPGIATKSTTASIGENLLREVPGIRFGPNSVTWQSLVTSFARAREDFLIDDETYAIQSAITIVSSELGTFLNPHDREMVDLLVELYDCRTGGWLKETKTQSNDEIVNPWINALACTTPAWIAGNFPDYLIGGGFTARCIWVYAEDKRQLVAHPSRHLASDHGDTRLKLIHDLEVMSQLRGEVSMTEDALAYAEVWYSHNYENKVKNCSNDMMAYYYSRKQSHLYKTAMVISASRRNDLTITVDDLETALGLLEAIELDIPKVFSQVGRTEITRSIEAIVKIVRKHKTISLSELYSTYFVRTMSSQEFDTAVQSAVRTGWVKSYSNGKEMILQSTMEGSEDGQ